MSNVTDGIQAVVAGIIVMLFGGLMLDTAGYGGMEYVYSAIVYVGFALFVLGPVYFWLTPTARHIRSKI